MATLTRVAKHILDSLFRAHRIRSVSACVLATMWSYHAPHYPSILHLQVDMSPCLSYFDAVILIQKRRRNKLLILIVGCDTPLEPTNIALPFALGANCSTYSVFRDNLMRYIRLGIGKTRGSMSIYYGHAKLL